MRVVLRRWAAMCAGREGAADPGARQALRGREVARVAVNARALWPGAPDRVGRMDRPSIHALLVARRVVPDDPEARAVAGVFLGTALGCAEVNARFHRGLVELGAEGASPLLFAQTLPSTPAGEAAIAFGLRGEGATLMAGRCSGVAAIEAAARAIRLRRLDHALVLAGDAFGEDEVALRDARRRPLPGEAAVALWLSRASTDDAPSLPTLRDARVATGAGVGGDPGEPDWLGASGLIELVRWLDGEGASFDLEIGCDSGRRAWLSAVRGAP